MQVPLLPRRSVFQASVLPAFLALTLAFPGTVLAGGGGPVPVQPLHAGRVVNVTLGETANAALSVHVGDTVLVHVVEDRIDDQRRWTVPSGTPGLRLVKRSEESQGDHGYLSMIYDLTYAYSVSPTPPGSHTLLFRYDNPPDADTSVDLSPPVLFFLTVNIR